MGLKERRDRRDLERLDRLLKLRDEARAGGAPWEEPPEPAKEPHASWLDGVRRETRLRKLRRLKRQDAERLWVRTTRAREVLKDLRHAGADATEGERQLKLAFDDWSRAEDERIAVELRGDLRRVYPRATDEVLDAMAAKFRPKGGRP